METDRLKYFCTIVESGSLTRAADLMGVSHSGLSKAMGVLQNEVGFALFKPHGRGLEVTAQGREIYNKSKSILASIDALKLGSTPSATPLRIGIQEVFSLSLAGAIAAEIPGELEFSELDSGEIELSLLSQKIDFGFTFVPFPKKEIEYLKVTKVSLRSFCQRGAFKGLPVEKIPYVIPSSELQDNPLSYKFRDGWNKEIPRLIRYRANNISAALSLVKSGLAAIYIPTFLANAMNRELTHAHQLVEIEMPVKRKSAEVTWRDIFLVKVGAETKVMKKATRVIRMTC